MIMIMWMIRHHDQDCNDDAQVQGGDNKNLGNQNYHPFYITSSRDGGYGKKSESERQNEVIWAGVKEPFK